MKFRDLIEELTRSGSLAKFIQNGQGGIGRIGSANGRGGSRWGRDRF